ncbi:serine/threonine-protein kinase MPS1-like [Silene latifolia]|uniref:serine/threonine-protein kinase MPS1-like n=1 Tax=Silene latifolia TaxID=37657 RepID=UPI003D78093C
MNAEDKLPGPHLTSQTNLNRSTNFNSSSSSSEPDFLRNVQAAFKRHRSIGAMPSSKLLPRRCVPPKRDDSKGSSLYSGIAVETRRCTNVGGHVSEGECLTVESREDASFTQPSICGTTNTFDEKYHPFGNSTMDDLAVEGSKKVQVLLDGSAVSLETDWKAINQMESLNVINNNQKLPNLLTTVPDCGTMPRGVSSEVAPKLAACQNQLHNLRNFLQNDGNQPVSHSSVVGSSCATTTFVHATSAPILSSATHSSRPHQDGTNVSSLGDANVGAQNAATGGCVLQACSSSLAVSTRASSSALDTSMDAKEIPQNNLLLQSQLPNDPSQCQISVKTEGCQTDTSNIPPSCSPVKNQPSNAKPELAKSEKHEKAQSRKKGYDPDLFFKVNGKLYQRLGKIGSGGSSEVHKVISSDCKIYALKKIKLKGRDYATAFGFCQEILYLKKLKGKNNIIQLIDYEVTDKALLQEVLNDSIINKDCKFQDDGYIYMVLEYGEIDLAHMLAQKWKEIEDSNIRIDDNWLRFYWQQILQAVNTIHEERIVHSDLKPANFLLVKGSLKLIDFGIAKAIMSDTTNIQRDAQVGTLSYMSPEAFLCNESDADGNIIKCGRPSDIWSLGCILYQMVYGRTPFSEYKTFWAKFKVITNPSHEITFTPVSNPWLLDLMKKCLAWDRNERWNIPELLGHPFLVPPVPHQLSPPEDQYCKAIQFIIESCSDSEKATSLCSELQQLLAGTTAGSRDQQVKLLSELSNICLQLRKHITETR